MKSENKILIVEDDNKILSFLSELLKTSGYDVITSKTGSGAVSFAASHLPQLIILDLGLPDIDGMKIIPKVRSWSDIPIIVLSARLNEQDKVNALDSGANDYITKPFGNDELLARIRSAIRTYKNSQGTAPIEKYENRELVIDFDKHRVYIGAESVHLTPLEYKILTIMSQNEGKVLTHEYLIRELWGPFTHDSQLLRVNIANIRRKIEKNPADPKFILTEVGIGYRMSTEDIY